MSVNPASGRKIIRPLPERLINKIAAGEVVERPAAVVKELVENAVDSGASRIEIHIEKAGVAMIKIVDNGCGIPAEQLEIAFARHATSKIASFADLEQILSYGFRGEALPSIASVSQTRMLSRPHDAESGCELRIDGGAVQSKSPAAAGVGTTIEVSNLFYNTPARRKFLKAETTETRHISRTVTALALSRADIGFIFTINERTIFSLPPNQSLEARTTGLLGTDKQFIAVSGQSDLASVTGYIGVPESAGRDRWGQYLFINNRFIQSPSLAHAITSGYAEMLPRGLFPIGVLLIQVNPSEVDVNVHPQKTEVRLSRERDVYDAIHAAVKNAVRQPGIIPSLGVARSEAVPVRETTFAPVSHHATHHHYSRQDTLLRELYRTNSPQLSQNAHSVPIFSAAERVDTLTGEITQAPHTLESKAIDQGLVFLGKFNNLYLLFQQGDSLLIVDQHTAHERVLFEQVIKQMEDSSVVSQRLLLSVQLELTPDQLALFESAKSILNDSGFEISNFGGRMISIDAVPVILGKKSPEKSLRSILDDIATLTKTGYNLNKAIAQSVACRSAVMRGDTLNDREASVLVESLLGCQTPYSCPHGRPTFVKIERSELDRRFGRA